jgi:hypothetical protein
VLLRPVQRQIEFGQPRVIPLLRGRIFDSVGRLSLTGLPAAMLLGNWAHMGNIAAILDLSYPIPLGSAIDGQRRGSGLGVGVRLAKRQARAA